MKEKLTFEERFDKLMSSIEESNEKSNKEHEKAMKEIAEIRKIQKKSEQDFAEIRAMQKENEIESKNFVILSKKQIEISMAYLLLMVISWKMLYILR